MFKSITNILFPRYCLLCSKPGLPLCSYCSRKLIPSLPECYKCRRISAYYKTHTKCRDMYSISSLFWAWQYNSLSSELVKTLKYKGSFDISDEIADLLIQRLHETGFLDHFSNPVFVPIPLHKKKEKERGFNQCVLIGKRLSEELKIPMDTDLLLREIYEKPQAEKNKTDRKKLSKETFTFDTARYISRYKGMEVILIDDVVTTGTTLDTASTSIKSKNRGIFTSAICLFRGRPDYSADSSAS